LVQNEKLVENSLLMSQIVEQRPAPFNFIHLIFFGVENEMKTACHGGGMG
jgi:hypothetical protein